MTTYHAVATWDGKWWFVRIEDLPEGYVGTTQGSTWSEALLMTEDAIALLLGIPKGTFSVDMAPAPDAVSEIRHLREVDNN